MTRSNTVRMLVTSVAALGLVMYLSAVTRGDTNVVNGAIVIPVNDDTAAFDGDGVGDVTVKGGVGLRSAGGQLLQRYVAAVQAGAPSDGDRVVSGTESGDDGGSDDDVFNTQVNDPALDHIVTFDPKIVDTRPFEFSTQSETSAVADGRHVVVGYNSSAGTTVQFLPGLGLAYTRLFLSGFSTSHDGGRTWKSGFIPSVSPKVPVTLGDPSLAMDRSGAIYYASLGTDATGAHGGLIVAKSVDHGDTWSAAAVAAVDDGSDKEWIAVGPDPTTRTRDNVYVTWSHFVFNARGATIASELWLARSIDGGHTFTTSKLFAPVSDGINSAFIQFSNPVVDRSSGRLYIPFLHFSDADFDNVRVLVSDDGGVHFRMLKFNAPGAIDAFAFPNVTPGIINDCTGGGFRNVLFAGPDQGGGRFGTRRYRQATRIISQPQAAVERGTFVFVINSSTSKVFGDPGAGSIIRAVMTRDGGQTWSTTEVIGSSLADPQHVHPALSFSSDEPEQLLVSYYVQQLNEQLRTDVTALGIHGRRLRVEGSGPLSSTAFDLTPSNVVRTPTSTTNYDRLIVSCYNIGEYQTLTRSRRGEDDDDDGFVIGAWGDNRRTWLSPPTSPAAGLHSQPDVFSAIVGDDSSERRDQHD